ncbi:hypothetical protein NIES4106_30540 [Fischerella sp. NIES-4106]|jgi:hypothetical protein|nr:hypothetical protein NIES4106_30540 [Fischerella sp. NIES-4106]
MAIAIKTERLSYPKLPITEIIPEYLNRSKNLGRNVTMKTFRALIGKFKS